MSDIKDDLPRIAHHEAGHGVVAALFGCAVELVSIKPAEHHLGTTIADHVPPSSFTELLGRRRGAGLLARHGVTPVPQFGSAFAAGSQIIMIALAGPVAEMLAPVSVARFVDERDDRDALEAARQLTEAQTTRLVEADRPNPTDDERAFSDAQSIGGPAAAGALMTWLGWETRRFVLSALVSGLVAEVADELLAHEVVDGEFVHGLVRREEDRLIAVPTS